MNAVSGDVINFRAFYKVIAASYVKGITRPRSKLAGAVILHRVVESSPNKFDKRTLTVDKIQIAVAVANFQVYEANVMTTITYPS